jgi:hypothetical protein
MASYRSYSVTGPSRLWWWLAIGSMVLAGVVLILPYTITFTDVAMLVLSGRYFLAHGVHLTPDPFSFAAPHLYLEHEWLWAIMAALVRDHGGWPALWGVKVVLAGGLFTLLIWLARRRGGSWGILTLSFLPCVYVVASRISERPGLLGSCLLLGILTVLVQVREGRWHPRALWLIPPTMVIYINAHGGWPLGLSLLGAMLLAEAVAWVRARSLDQGQALPGRLLLELAAVLVLTVPYPMGSIEGLHKDSCKSGHMTQMELHESRKPGPSVRTSLKREVLQRLEGFPLVIRAAMPSGSGPVLRRWACGLMPWGWTWTLCATP